MKTSTILLYISFLTPFVAFCQYNGEIEGTSHLEIVDVTKQMRIGSGWLDQDLVEINSPADLPPFRVRTDGTTRIRVFNNGAVSLLSNWGNPQPNELRINGNTGILVNDPIYPLHVNGNTKFDDSVNSGGFLFSSNTGGFVDGSSLQVLDLNGNPRAWLGAGSVFVDYGFLILRDDVGNDRVIIRGEGTNDNDAGYIEVKSGNDPSIVLDANYGGSGFSRVATDELEIKGGADLAELFELPEELESSTLAGMLVSADPANPGKLMVTRKERDRLLVGVVSGAHGIRPGLLLGQESTIADGDVPVTIAGRAYVRANTSKGPIEVGDFLTSSAQTGEACRARNIRKSTGSIIGKALTPLPSGEGHVLVLINLQ